MAATIAPLTLPYPHESQMLTYVKSETLKWSSLEKTFYKQTKTDQALDPAFQDFQDCWQHTQVLLQMAGGKETPKQPQPQLNLGSPAQNQNWCYYANIGLLFKGFNYIRRGILD